MFIALFLFEIAVCKINFSKCEFFNNILNIYKVSN